MTGEPGKPPLLSLALVSAAALGGQVLWLRVMAVIQWHHFAFMIISLALLGYGASGTALTLSAGVLRRYLREGFAVCALLFAATLVPALVIAQTLAFNPEELLWRPALALNLAALYLILGTPFFFAGGAVGIVFMGWGERAGRIYAADLAGAACGAVLAVLVLWQLSPASALSGAAAVGALAAALAGWRATRARIALVALAVALLLALIASPAPRLAMSPYKDLAQALQVDGARIEVERASPHGQVAVVASPRVPIRDAPGLGLRAKDEPPEQRAVFVDGNSATSITRATGDPGPLAFLHALPTAAPYAVVSARRVLVLGAGGGMLALQAREAGATHVLAVEPNPDLMALVEDDYAEFAGRLYGRPPVTAVASHPRSFLAGNREEWDLIQLPPAGGPGTAAGLMSLGEDYLRTTDAVGAMLDRLAPGGILALHSFVSLPPKDMLRLAAIAVEALRTRGVSQPDRSLMALRSWQWASILLRVEGFGETDARALRDFADRYGYDLAWHAEMPRSSANSVNRMSRPWLYDAIADFASGGDADFLNAYKFDLRPTTDDRPFFHNYLRWRTVPEILPLMRSGGMPLLEAGYLMLVAVFLQAVAFGFVLIVLPLAIGGCREAIRREPALAARVMIYFAAIGLAFMFMELAAIHRFILFLEQPVYASAAVIGAFLVFAGAGSLASRLSVDRLGRRGAAALGAGATVFVGMLWLLFLDEAVGAAAGESLGLRLLLAVAFIGPLAFAMGHLFPSAVAELAGSRPDLVPWAWAINGCASVVGAVSATMISVAIGFDNCLLIALALYLVTIASFPRLATEPR